MVRDSDFRSDLHLAAEPDRVAGWDAEAASHASRRKIAGTAKADRETQRQRHQQLTNPTWI
jgi:hypothetical protein